MTPMHRYACALFACVALLAGGTAAVNVARDPLGLFTQDFAGVRQEPAQHFLKMRYVLAHPGRYDSFAFGSSRMAKIDLSGAGDGWYTLSYSQGTPAEWLRDVQMLVADGVSVRRLLVGLDDASFRLPGDVHDEDTGFRRPYRAWDAAFYLQELFRRPQRLDTAWVADHGSVFDLYGTGRVYVPERVEAAIDANPAAHARDERLYASSAYRGNYMEETLRTLSELVALAEAHGIELTFFFHPIYQTTYMDNDAAELDEWVKARTIRFGAVSEKLLNNRTFWRTYLPLYRADYGLISGYRFEALRLSTDVPATVFYSQTDTPIGDMRQWRRYFTGPCDFHCFEGNHFFIRDHQGRMAEIIKDRMDG